VDGDGRGVHRVLVGKPEGKNHLEDGDVDWRIVLRWIYRKWKVGIWTGLSCLMIKTGGEHLWMVMNLRVP
jgi:hypothetical protein